MIIGFTGTADGMSANQRGQLQEFLDRINCTEFHHGDCVGADAQAHDIAFALSIPIIIHPPIKEWKRARCTGGTILPEKDYIARNHDIVDICNVLVACPRSATEEQRSGTWATYRYAAKVGRTTCLILP